MQTVERPRFRQDLVAEPIEDGATRFIDVADPDSGQLFRFYEVEYSLACAMDGDRDVAGIVKWAKDELGLEPSANEVRTVVATLGSLGFLDGGVVAARPAAVAPVEAPRHAPTPATAPAAKSATPEGFERGVVAGSKRASSPVADVELGTPGVRGTARAEELPNASDLEPVRLAPGLRRLRRPRDEAATSSRLARPVRAGKPAAGKPAGSSVSTDLVADMAISPADVKEAVRASQVMKSVDVPPELAAELESKPVAKAQSPAPRVDPTPVPVAAAAPRPMPTERPVLPTAPTAPTAPSSGVSPILIAALVLALLGVGGFLVYKYVIKKPEANPASSSLPAQPKVPEPPVAPPVETAKLAAEQPAPEEIRTSTAATVATIVANDSAVKIGDAIVRLVGYKPLETEVAALTKEIEKTKADIATATKERDAAQTAGSRSGLTRSENKLAAYSKALGIAEGKLPTKTSALDKLLVKASAAGKVTAVAKPNTKVTPTDIIATLTRDPVLVATFKSAGEVAADARVLLAIKGSEQKLSCAVVATGGDGIKIACPKDAAPEGTEVTYAGVDPSAPPLGPPAPEAPGGDKPADPADVTPGDAPPTPHADKPEDKPAKRPAPKYRPAAKPDKAAEPAEPPADKPVDPPPAP